MLTTRIQSLEHFASSVQFVLDDLDAARRLHALTTDLRTAPRLGTLLPQVPPGAMGLVGGDYGNIQIVDPVTGSLRSIRPASGNPTCRSRSSCGHGPDDRYLRPAAGRRRPAACAPSPPDEGRSP
jgi:hypothetical protein